MGRLPAPSSASMLSRSAIDKAAIRVSPSVADDSEALRSSASFSRYRLLGEEEQRREAEAVQRIVRDLTAQRRSKGEASRHKGSSDLSGHTIARPSSADPSRSRRKSTADESSDATCCPEASASPMMKSKPDRSKREYGRNRHPKTTSQPESPLDSPTSSPTRHPTGEHGSLSFQTQVMEELRRLKEAQRRDLAAIESLKRQKEQAEERARQLAKKLQRESARSSGSVASRACAREIVLEEPPDYDEEGCADAVRDNNRSLGDAFEDGEGGDESVPPWAASLDDEADEEPPYYGDSDIASDHEGAVAPLDSTSPRKWSARSSTLVSKHRSSATARGRSRPSTPSRSRYPSQSPSRGRSPSSASQPRRPSRGASVGRSSVDLSVSRRSCAFFDEKERQQLEEEERERQTAERIARAARAAPPKQLLEHEEAARRRKAQQLRALQREMNAELSKDKRVKARDVPLTTYLSPSMASDGDTAGVDTESQRSERIRRRSQELLQAAALPPRMATATATASDPTEPQRVTIKMKHKLQEAARLEAERRRRRPKPVPDFDRLHRQWDKALAKTRARHLGASARGDGDGEDETGQPTGVTVCKEFFVSRADKLEELRARKEARRAKLEAEEQERQRLDRERQEKLLERVKKGGVGGVKAVATKTEQLRVQKLLADAAKAEKRRRREQKEAEARDRRQREATRRVAAQVQQAEARRRDEYSGAFVELPTDAVSERAKESRQQFKEAMQRNRAKLLASVALRPSLMERFTTDVKREEHKRAALEAVASRVLGDDAALMKGVLTDEEQALAQELAAAKGSDDERE